MQINGQQLVSSDSRPNVLRVNNVAKRLGLSTRMVRHLAQNGVLRAYKDGIKLWRFVSTDVEAFRMQREQKHA